MTVSILAILIAVMVPAVMQARATTRRTVANRISGNGLWGCKCMRMPITVNFLSVVKVFSPRPGSMRLMIGLTRYHRMLKGAPYIDLVNARKKPKAGDSSIWVCPDAVSIDELRAGDLYPAVRAKSTRPRSSPMA